MAYFEVSPPEFFSGLKEKSTLRAALEEKLQQLSNEDLEKVSLFISWITESTTDSGAVGNSLCRSTDAANRGSLLRHG